MIYFTSDPHFYHANIIKLCNRPFDNIDQMNEQLIDNWNQTVGPGDDIYVLGDFFYKASTNQAIETLDRLNGRKYLVEGNHDDTSNAEYRKRFVWIKDYHVLKHDNNRFVLFHYPILEWDGYYSDAIHLYGHVHSGRGDHDKNAVNVAVERWGYRPVSIDDVLDEVRKKNAEGLES
ncbi:MAG: metallophosphoesterase family protein [Polyangiaceae bacterium]|nr:metallophosphoesterase family protein [Polyangiaceae bacterium]